MKALLLSLFFISFFLLQKVIPFRQRHHEAWVTNLSMGTLSFLSTLFWLKLFHVTNYIEKGLLQKLSLPYWSQILLTIFILDGLSYAWHWANHHFTLLWKFHRCHHSDIDMGSSSAFRFHFIETNLSLIPRFTVVLLLGLPAEGLIYFEIVYQLFNICEHSNIKLPTWLEKAFSTFFVTPAYHRLHHSTKPEEQTKNLTTIFSFWDILGRTRKPNKKDEAFPLGLKEVPNSLSLKELLTLPFRSLH